VTCEIGTRSGVQSRERTAAKGDRMRYSFRPQLFRPAVEFELTDNGLSYRGALGTITIPFGEIDEINVFKERRFGSSRSYWACTICALGQRFRLSAVHRVTLTRTEDKTSTYIPFIKEFERCAIAANPGLRFVVDEYREGLGTQIYGRAAAYGLVLLGFLPRKASASLCAVALRSIGPILKGNRYARQQLTVAFPALGRQEISRLLCGMWDNIGRSLGEYPHISELMQFSPETPLAGQVVMDERTAETVLSIARDARGALMFAAHLGNWEIPAMAARAAGCKIALLYKRQPSSGITTELNRRRAMFAARLIEASPKAPREILSALREGYLVGMLVDQYYAQGIEAFFFGQTCLVNPLLARLACTTNLPIYGARVVRLPDQRYRLEVVGPLKPCVTHGKIDVDATMQTVIGMVETWIRQQPEQWMWIHRLAR
jgi:KDO2-lipid IV(A) lauroyltransferase